MCLVVWLFGYLVFLVVSMFIVVCLIVGLCVVLVVRRYGCLMCLCFLPVFWLIGCFVI